MFRRIAYKLPFPKSWKLEWWRSYLDKHYSKVISAAKKEKNYEKAQMLNSEYIFEMTMHEEEEDGYITTKFLRKARKLRIPIPSRVNDEGQTTSQWYQGQYTGGWYLTTEAIFELRKEIRQELKELHELRAKWIVWLSALTGVIGTITGLVAVLGKHG